MDLTWLKNLAPTVAAALGGPLAGVAVEAIGSALGWSDATKDKVDGLLTKGQLTGAEVLALKTAELALARHEKELGFKFAELEVADRQGARGMQVQTRSRMPAVLSIVIVVGFLALLTGMMLDVLKVEDSQALLIMLGSLGAAFAAVIAFWFGTTHGSAEKTALIAKAPAVK